MDAITHTLRAVDLPRIVRPWDVDESSHTSRSDGFL